MMLSAANNQQTCLRLAITPGEPAGIGYDLLVLLAQQAYPHELVVFGDADVLAARADQLGLTLKTKQVDWDQATQPQPAQTISLQPIKTQTEVIAGKLDLANATFVLSCLDQAIAACQSGQCAAMITGPVQKSVINAAGVAFSGHTEYLAENTNTEKVVMMLATEGLRVALATTHLPLREVSAAITPESLSQVIRILHADLKHKFGIADPNILVCGLNPHAGEGGHLGREEIEMIQPVIKSLREEGMQLSDPLPADTLFTPKYLDKADAVLAMYHDQGLPVLKYKGFGNAVNVTLGLPIIRTSVDHGTALDLAGTGKVDVGSLCTALAVAVEMASSNCS